MIQLNHQGLIISCALNFKTALAIMDEQGKGILFVVNENNALLGVLTDGDVRRAMLRGVSLEINITEIINKDYKYYTNKQPRDSAIAYLKNARCRHLPVINDKRQLVDIILLDELDFRIIENYVVLMVGGLGTRLRPFTLDTPKPMLDVGGKPFLENIINMFISQGFRNFYLCVNYQGEKIMNYFNDGSKWGISIQYICEKNRMGTAGALSLLPETPQLPFIVMNGDILTKVDFSLLLKYHQQQQSMATMCVREFECQIPYGIVKMKEDHNHISSIIEKPIFLFKVNAGIYVIEPQCLDYIEKNTLLDMPELFTNLINMGLPSTCFPIHDFWLDIGRVEDLEKAKLFYE